MHSLPIFLYSSTLFEYLVCFQYDSFTICFFQYHLLFSIYFPSPLFLNLTFNRFLFLFFSFIILFLTSLFQDNFFHLFLFQYYTILPPSLLSAFLFSFVFFFPFLIVRLHTSFSLSLTLVPPLCPFTHLSPFFRIEQIKRIDRACAERSKTVPWPAARMIYSGANHPPEISDTPNEFLGWCAYVCKDGRGLKEIWGEPTTPSTTRVLTEISTSRMLIERYSPNILSC